MSEVKRYGHIGYLVNASEKLCELYQDMTVYVKASDYDALEAKLNEEWRNYLKEASFLAERDAAQSELAALREELARVKAQSAQRLGGLAACGVKREAAEQRHSAHDIESAAMVLANCMDYPWEHMPENGRILMRKHAKDVVDAALAQPTESGASE